MYIVCLCADEYSFVLFYGQDGHSPLYAACDWDHPDVVDILLQGGADPNLVSQVYMYVYFHFSSDKTLHSYDCQLHIQVINCLWQLVQG